MIIGAVTDMGSAQDSTYVTKSPLFYLAEALQIVPF